MGYPLYHGSRQFVTVTIRENDWIIIRGEEETSRRESTLDKYAKRMQQCVSGDPLGLEKLSLYEVASRFSYREKSWYKRRVGKEAIVRVFVILHLGENPLRNEMFYHQQVVLNVP